MSVIDEIAAERKRQISEEGWTPEHDDGHAQREMAIAAACYAAAPSMVRIEREWVPPDTPKNWPWHFSWWKPGLKRRNLIKAGALIVAEIERMDRAVHQNCPCGGWDCTGAPEGPMHDCPYRTSAVSRPHHSTPEK
jgi:hypothetical protein